MAVAGSGRDLLARTALAHVPHVLTLLDRNRHSPTYGCFDRGFWHYRIVDFPSGMAQNSSSLWPSPGDGSRRQPLVPSPRPARMGRRRHPLRRRQQPPRRLGGRLLPFERAAGATAFSLLAGLEACRILDLRDDAVRGFFARRADWLAASREPGRSPTTKRSSRCVSCSPAPS